ncbi:MAG: hypothetical protein WC374_09985 [Phycisphaerae bacterium]|jgi:hypothetical protein
MKIRIDFKSAVIGFLLGAVVFLAMGQLSADRFTNGIAIAYNGSALVQDSGGILYIVEPDRARAQIVQYSDGPLKGNFFNINRSQQNQK